PTRQAHRGVPCDANATGTPEHSAMETATTAATRGLPVPEEITRSWNLLDVRPAPGRQCRSVSNLPPVGVPMTDDDRFALRFGPFWALLIRLLFWMASPDDEGRPIKSTNRVSQQGACHSWTSIRTRRPTIIAPSGTSGRD